MRIHATLLLSGLSFSCEGGREGGREDGYVGRQTWICTIPGLYMHDERERLLLATWPVVLNGRV